MSNDYFLETGDFDRERLTILSELYNPRALQFLIDSGLKPGMTLLEVGCGTGHMACDVANYLGPGGKVIAIDSSEKQIEVAKETAKQRGVDNIDFYTADVMNLAELDLSYDATYGKWVLEFLPDPKAALALMYASLKTGGILAYESSNMNQSNYFSSPHNPVVGQWHANGPKLFKEHACDVNFAYEGAYPTFLALGCKQIRCENNQAILSTQREKSVYRLGLLSSAEALITKGIATQDEIDLMMQALLELENSNTITGFFHNVLVSGVK